MRLWPFGRGVETRDADYSQEAVSAMLRAAQGGYADARQTAAVAMVSGLVGRMLSLSRVEPMGTRTASLTPETLYRIGRDWTAEGESLHVLELHAGALVLVPAVQWEVRGRNPIPATWRWRCTLAAPDGMTDVTLGPESVVHISTGPAGMPWRGRGPLHYARESARLAAEAERVLGDESAGPMVNLLPQPPKASQENVDELLAQIRTNRGRAVLVESTSAGYGGGRVDAPQGDWTPKRLGPAPPPTLAHVRDQAEISLLGALGAAPALFNPEAAGQALAASYELLRRSLVEPLARLAEVELTLKLEVPVVLHLDHLAGSVELLNHARADAQRAGAEAKRAGGSDG